MNRIIFAMVLCVSLLLSAASAEDIVMGEDISVIPMDIDMIEEPSAEDETVFDAEVQSDDEEYTDVTCMLDRTSAVLCPGDDGIRLNVLFSDDANVNTDGTAREVLFTSSNMKCVTVDSDGALHGIAQGSSTITAQCAFEGKTQVLKCSVKVLKAPKSVSISPSKAVLTLGKAEQGTFKLKFASGYGASCAFSSSDESVAVVDAYGTVTALKKGCVTITAVPFKGKPASAVLTVYASASEIQMDTDALTLGQGMKHTMKYTLPEYEQDTIEWTSSDESIAAVSKDGIITAIGTGVCTICAKASDSGVSAECFVTVEPGPDALLLSDQEIRLGKGNIIDLFACGILRMEPEAALTQLTYKSSNKSIVTVRADGCIKGVKAGKAVITVSAANGISCKLRVTVSSYPKSVKLTPSSLRLGIDMTEKLKVSFNSKAYSRTMFSSDAPEIVSVDPETGVLTALKEGTAVITCACVSGSAKAVCRVSVLGIPESIDVEEPVVNGYAGKSGLVVAGTYPEGTMCGFRYEVIEGAEYVAVDAFTGELILLSEGSAKVRVTADNNPDAMCDCLINVCPAPEDIQIDCDTVTIGRGNTFQLAEMISYLPANAQTELSFKSSASSYVSVSTTGKVKGEKTGSAFITIRTANGIEKKINVKVLGYPTEMKLSKTQLKLSEGTSDQLSVSFGKGTGSLYRFETSDSGIAAVDPATGMINALQAGNCVISCVCVSGTMKAACKLTVLPEPTEITIEPDSSVIGVGDSVALKALLNNESNGTYVFESLTPDLAVIDAETGRVRCLAEGTARIRAVSYNGLSAEAEVMIIKAPDKVRVLDLQGEDDRYCLDLRRGEEFALHFDTGEYSSISTSFDSSDRSIVDVDENGVIKALRSGTAVITVKHYNGCEAAIEVSSLKWTETMGQFMISHAMGGIGGYAYTNCLEAFNENYAEGHRVFEVDFSYTKDGVPVLWHDWGRQVSSKTKAGVVPTLQQFMNVKIKDKYTPLQLRDLIKLMIRYPDIMVITDSKDDSITGTRRFINDLLKTCSDLNASKVLGRFIIQVYSEKMFETVESIYHFDSYIYTVYKQFAGQQPTRSQMLNVIKFCADNGIDMLTMPYSRWKDVFMEDLREYDVDVALHTVNSASDAKKFLAVGVKAIYTDTLSPIK